METTTPNSNATGSAIEELREHILEISKVATATATIVNVLMLKAGLTYEDIAAAVKDSGITSFDAEFFRSEGEGTVVSDSGILDSRVSAGPSNGDVAGGPRLDSGRQTQQDPNVDEPIGRVDAEIRSASGKEASTQEG